LPSNPLSQYIPMSIPLLKANAEHPSGVNSMPGGGTVTMSDAAKRSGVPAPRPAVVLIVDDDTSVLIASRRILAKYGYTVLEASGGEEALQVARDNAEHIDVVLTDVRMPGLDGPSLVRKLADILDEPRVVYMSGYTDGRLDQELPAPRRAFLAKPFTVEQLTRTLAAILI
jgi:CheY-like chemotaxis protein